MNFEEYGNKIFEITNPTMFDMVEKGEIPGPIRNDIATGFLYGLYLQRVPLGEAAGMFIEKLLQPNDQGGPWHCVENFEG